MESGLSEWEIHQGLVLKAVWGSVCAFSHEEQQNNDSNSRKLYERIIDPDHLKEWGVPPIPGFIGMTPDFEKQPCPHHQETSCASY